MLRLLLALPLKFLLISFVVRRALEHGCGDFGVAGPVAALLPCVRLIVLQAAGVWLHHRVMKDSASLRTSRRRVMVAAGSSGGSLSRRRKSASV